MMAAEAPTVIISQEQIILGFHTFAYLTVDAWTCGAWRGCPILKSPVDLMVMQELVNLVKPDLVIETGTRAGGSALFWADMLQLYGRPGRVLTIDDKKYANQPKHPRITYRVASSTSKDTLRWVKSYTRHAKRVLIDLDSSHKKAHVLREMELYAPLVSVGSFMIVEDTNLNGHPIQPNFGPGPWEAVEEFLAKHKEFVQDQKCEGYCLTFNPGGWLRKVA